jgi:hemolysin III
MQYGERFNTISHFLAACFSVFGAGLLLSIAFAKNDLLEIISFGIYAVTTVGLYSTSTLYHGTQGSIKNLFRRMDYIGIYLKIAGNYTPFMILLLRGSVGWVVLSCVWMLALVGIVLEFMVGRKTRRYSMIIYGLMTFCALPIVKHLADALPVGGVSLILAGYISYFIGFYFYANDTRIKHGHGLWHLGVIGGTLCQFLCLLFYVA